MLLMRTPVKLVIPILGQCIILFLAPARSPSSPGSGYVLLHHVMGELEGVRGAWGYPEGGMGAVSGAIAKAALAAGANIFTEQEERRRHPFIWRFLMGEGFGEEIPARQGWARATF